jgi:hypothetical protein
MSFFQYLGSDADDGVGTTNDVSDDEWHECREGSPNPFSNSEYEFSDDNDIQSECSESPLLAATSSHEEQSEDHRPFYALTKDEQDIYFQMDDIVGTLEHRAETLPSVALTPDFVTAWRHFELAMFGFAAEPRIGEVPVRTPVVVNPETAPQRAQSADTVF